jgi:hypothetical protein
MSIQDINEENESIPKYFLSKTLVNTNNGEDK